MYLGDIKLNSIIHGDCLEIMKQIPDNYIDLIYCDILYNTGKKFKDYDDRLGTPQEAIKWYEPRLIEMRRVLKEAGSIYLQCDYRLVHYLKVKMDELFGIDNFRNEIVWCYRQGGRSETEFSKKHDTILWYSKGQEWIFNTNNIRVPYNGTGGYIRNNNGNVINGKRYKPNPLGKIPEDWWDIPALTPTNRERVGYDTQKPKELLERIIKASSNVGDIVADFFCGSGTSLVVAKELGRNYIGCDINPRAVEITEQRLKEVEEPLFSLE